MTVTETGSPAVAPVPVTLKPEIYAVLAAADVSVAVAVAAATFPEEATSGVAPAGYGLMAIGRGVEGDTPLVVPSVSL